MQTMYYVLQDFTQPQPYKTQRLMLGENSVVVTAHALYGRHNVYILPTTDGMHDIAGRHFVRQRRGILVRVQADY